MIEVIVTKNGEPIAHIEIKHNVSRAMNADPDLGDYQIRMAVERGKSVGIHERKMYSFPRKQYNVLALVRSALATLEPKELYLDSGYDPDSQEASVSTDLARRLGGTMREIQARVRRLYRD